MKPSVTFDMEDVAVIKRALDLARSLDRKDTEFVRLQAACGCALACAKVGVPMPGYRDQRARQLRVV